jgi:hypothetical protein
VVLVLLKIGNMSLVVMVGDGVLAMARNTGG